jgi:hypothetical protein
MRKSENRQHIHAPVTIELELLRLCGDMWHQETSVEFSCRAPLFTMVRGHVWPSKCLALDVRSA